MFSRFERLLFALMFALLAAGVTLVVVRAQDGGPTQPAQPTQVPSNPSAQNCAACHSDIYATWQKGLHGQAMNDPVFTVAWDSQGKPGACLVCHTTGYDPASGTSEANSVSCTVCHSPIPANHPVDKMPTDTSSDLCGKCHSDPRFSTANWQSSAHYQTNMSCTTCHDPHAAGLKTIPGTAANDDGSALCENCHKDAMKNFPTSKHAQAGVTCVTCHLGTKAGGQQISATDFINAHKAPDHSFLPSLATCNSCHSTQMHGPGEAVAAQAIQVEAAGGTPTAQPASATAPQPPQLNEAGLSPQPNPVSPIGYAGLAGLIGLAAGMVLAPWLEKWYRRLVKHDREAEND